MVNAFITPATAMSSRIPAAAWDKIEPQNITLQKLKMGETCAFDPPGQIRQ